MKLTKEWLMGVRRGWLQFMKPPISSYDDVIKAHDRLDQFVENLQEQIQYIRRGGVKRLLDDRYEAKLESAFEKVFKAIEESRDKARYWKSYIDGTAISLRWGEDRTEDALRMLDLYKKDFTEASNTTIETRGHKWKAVSLISLLDEVLKLLRSDAAAIQKHDKANPDSPFVSPPEILKEFHIGNMKFILVLGPEDKPSYASGYAGLLKKVYAIIQAKRLKHLWYGICFLTPSCETLDEKTLQDYERRGYDRKYLKCRAGWYRYNDDVIAFTSYPTPNVFIYGLLHELGHRQWFKFMSSYQRARYANWINSKAVDAVSDYGKSNPEEAFAEAFARYTTGRDMTRDQIESFREVTFGRQAALKVARRYILSGYLNIGDPVFYGKWKNTEGRIIRFGKNEKGDPTIILQPIDKDGKPKKSKPKEPVMLKVRKVEPEKKKAWTESSKGLGVVENMSKLTATRVAARFLEALDVGKTFENEKWRIHRFRPSIRITDLTNAGKRGKKVREITLYDLDYAPNFPVESIAMELVMHARRGANFDRMLQVAKEAEEIGAKLDVRDLRGVDVTPGGFEELTVKGQGVLVEVGYQDFKIVNTDDTYNLSTCIPAIKGGKKSIPAFYRWVKDNQDKIRTMSFVEVVRAMKDEGIKYYQYCAMD